MLPMFDRLEGHMLEVLQTQARHGEALNGINRRLDVLNGKVAVQEAKTAEHALAIAEQSQGLVSHASTCEVRTLLEDIRRQIAASLAAERATAEANRSWRVGLLPLFKGALQGLAWVLGALMIFHRDEIAKILFK